MHPHTTQRTPQSADPAYAGSGVDDHEALGVWGRGVDPFTDGLRQRSAQLEVSRTDVESIELVECVGSGEHGRGRAFVAGQGHRDGDVDVVANAASRRDGSQTRSRSTITSRWSGAGTRAEGLDMGDLRSV